MARRASTALLQYTLFRLGSNEIGAFSLKHFHNAVFAIFPLFFFFILSLISVAGSTLTLVTLKLYTCHRVHSDVNPARSSKYEDKVCPSPIAQPKISKLAYSPGEKGPTTLY
jgi:hypothetical protein